MVRVAITIPEDVFQAAEEMRLRSDGKVTRSEFFRRAVEEYLRRRTPTKENIEKLEAFFDQEKEGDLEEWVVAAAQYAFDPDDSWEEVYREMHQE